MERQFDGHHCISTNLEGHDGSGIWLFSLLAYFTPGVSTIYLNNDAKLCAYLTMRPGFAFIHVGWEQYFFDNVPRLRHCRSAPIICRMITMWLRTINLRHLSWCRRAESGQTMSTGRGLLSSRYWPFKLCNVLTDMWQAVHRQQNQFSRPRGKAIKGTGHIIKVCGL